MRDTTWQLARFLDQVLRAHSFLQHSGLGLGFSWAFAKGQQSQQSAPALEAFLETPALSLAQDLKSNLMAL